MIVTNGSSFDKNLTTSDAEALKDKEKESTDATNAASKESSKAVPEKVDPKPSTTKAAEKASAAAPKSARLT